VAKETSINVITKISRRQWFAVADFSSIGIRYERGAILRVTGIVDIQKREE
jgi:hypothetical protein